MIISYWFVAQTAQSELSKKSSRCGPIARSKAAEAVSNNEGLNIPREFKASRLAVHFWAWQCAP